MNGVIDTLKFTNSNSDTKYNLYPRTLVEAITNQDGETLENLLQNSGGSNQFTIISDENLQTGWYRVATSSAPFHSCLIGVQDFVKANIDSDMVDTQKSIIADILYSSSFTQNVKVLNNTVYNPFFAWPGIDAIRSIYDEENEKLFIDIHYTATYETITHSLKLTFTNLNVSDEYNSVIRPYYDSNNKSFEAVDDNLDMNLYGLSYINLSTSTSSNLQTMSTGFNVPAGWKRYAISQGWGLSSEAMIHIQTYNCMCSLWLSLFWNLEPVIKVVSCRRSSEEVNDGLKIRVVCGTDEHDCQFFYLDVYSEYDMELCHVTIDNLNPYPRCNSCPPNTYKIWQSCCVRPVAGELLENEELVLSFDILGNEVSPVVADDLNALPKLLTMTEAEYNDMENKDENTFYFIVSE